MFGWLRTNASAVPWGDITERGTRGSPSNSLSQAVDARDKQIRRAEAVVRCIRPLVRARSNPRSDQEASWRRPPRSEHSAISFETGNSGY